MNKAHNDIIKRANEAINGCAIAIVDSRRSLYPKDCISRQEKSSYDNYVLLIDSDMTLYNQLRDRRDYWAARGLLTHTINKKIIEMKSSLEDMIQYNNTYLDCQIAETLGITEKYIKHMIELVRMEQI